jgi:hypothetical protein
MRGRRIKEEREWERERGNGSRVGEREEEIAERGDG